jgi:4-hydroxy-2-oxoheptanedioate aldolase
MNLNQRLRAGDTLAAAWLGINHSFVAEVVVRQGFDVAIIDMQHGLQNTSDIAVMLQVVQPHVAGMVRVPWTDAATIMKVLDMGAEGVIVPLVNTPDEANMIVSACRYPPHGIRSYGPTRAAHVFPDYVKKANDSLAIFAMIETAEGLANLESICKTPGLTGIFIGPADLSYALGLEPQADNPEPKHMDAVKRIVQVCKENQLVVGIYGDDPAYLKQSVAWGIQLVVVATDTTLLSRSAKQKLLLFQNKDGETVTREKSSY